MKLEIIDNELYIDGEKETIVVQKKIGVPYPTYGMSSDSHYDYKNSKCKNYTFFHNQIRKIDFIEPKDFIEDVYFDCYDFEREENTLLGIYKKDENLFVSKFYSIDYHNWNEYFPLKIFLDNFPIFLKNDSRFFFCNEMFSLRIFIKIKIENRISVNKVKKEIDLLFQGKYQEFLNLNKLSKSIEFTSEHLIAGSSILQYFGKLLQEKYPDEQISVSIKQEGLKVTMIIETPEGKKEEIEEYLNRYGMVVTNQITPQEFTSNPIQVLELETKLGQAEQEIKFQKKLLALQDKTYDENLTSLKDEVKFLRNELSALRVSNNENIQLLLSSLLKKDKLINKLTKSIEKRDDTQTKQLLLELKEKDSQGYISLKQHMDNAIIGGIINAPSWIQFTVGIFSRVG